MAPSATTARSGRVLTPGRYIGKDLWRNRSRSLFSISGMAALVFLIVLFSSMRAGLDRYFRDDIGIPTQEEQDLFEVKEVMDSWIYLVGILCTILFALIVTNTATITVIERRLELATLRAIGLTLREVGLLVAGSMGLQMVLGVAIGTLLGLLASPLMDDAAFALGGGGIGIPFAIDPSVFLVLGSIVLVAGAVGMIPPIVILGLRSPQEVLRNG